MVRVSQVNTLTPWKFTGSNGEIYRQDGRRGLFFENKMDLVAVSEGKICLTVYDAMCMAVNRVAF
jgi:hypothetical protein